MEQGQGHGEYEPNFTMPHRDAVHEENWAEFEARGIGPWMDSVPEDRVDSWVDGRQLIYGAENVYTGDAFDREAGRPLQHKPGKGIYVDFRAVEEADSPQTSRGADARPSEDARELQ